MKRVGNKSSQLVRSASRRGKASSRFQFDIHIDRVYGIKPGAAYLVKWSRGVKVAQTKVYTSPRDAAKTGLQINHKLSLLVTLFREDGKRFDPKDAKIALVSVNQKTQQRTVAKFHFDLAQFAGVPSSSKPQVFKLSDKVSIKTTVDSRFLKAGNGPGSAGASSVLSGVSARSSDDEMDDDFDDLAIDDVPEPQFSSVQAKSKRPQPLDKRQLSSQSLEKRQQSSNSKVPLLVETPRSSSSSVGSDRKKSSSSSSALPPSPSPPSARAPPSPQKPQTVSPVKKSQTASPAKQTPVPSTEGDDVRVFQRAEHESKIMALKRSNEKLTQDLSQSKRHSQSLEENHHRAMQRLSEELEGRTRELTATADQKASMDMTLSELRKRNMELEDSVKASTSELDMLRRERDELQLKSKRLSASESKCRQLSREVDRLTIAAAASPSNSAGDENRADKAVEERIVSLRAEKDVLEGKVRAHESHASKVKNTYEQLSKMYSELRQQHTALQDENDQLKAEPAAPGVSTSPLPQDGDLRYQLDDARQQLRDVQDSKASLQSDYEHVVRQADLLQERLDHTSRQFDDAQAEIDNLLSETEELKGQRDMAMQRALSKGKSNSSSNSDSSRSVGKVEENLRVTTERFERDHTRLTRRIQELESEISELREDIEYEKGEKLKAREERDKIRESARALERRTSLAARQTDAMHTMRRKLSTQQMREQDHEAMIADLRNEADRMRSKLDETKRAAEERRSSSNDEVNEVLRDLVSSKMKLAQAEDDKLQLQFAMKKLKKAEKAAQERLAAHASRLEVQLGEANEEAERLRRLQRRSSDVADHNEVGSDVDY